MVVCTTKRAINLLSKTEEGCSTSEASTSLPHEQHLSAERLCIAHKSPLLSCQINFEGPLEIRKMRYIRGAKF